MALSVETLTWDCRSTEVITRFWAGVLGYEVVELDEEDALIRDPNGEGWPFGGTIRYSKVYQRVFAVPGVDSVNRLVIRLDGEDQPECRDIPIAPGALLFTNGHQVTVQYALEMEAAQ